MCEQVSSLVQRFAAPSRRLASATAWDQARRAAERRCLRLAFGVVSAGAVCFGSRPATSARTAASRGGWRRRRRPGTRLAAAPRVRTASCAVHAALALSRALSDGVPRPRSNAKLRPLDVSPEILSLRRSGYAMVTASALTAMAIVQSLLCGAGPVPGAVLSTRRARSTAPSNQKDSWPLGDLLVS